MNGKIQNRRALILVVLLLLAVLAFGLTFALQDFVRDTFLVPLSYLLWIADLLIDSTPQALFWGLLVIIGLILAGWSLTVVSRPAQTGNGPAGDRQVAARRQRVGFWIIQVSMAQRGYPRLSLFSQRFADFFSRLALEVLAFREQVTPLEAERGVQNREIPVPPEIQEFLRHSRAMPAAPVGWLSSVIAWLVEAIRGGKQGGEQPGLSEELEAALRYLEDQLEVKHDI